MSATFKHPARAAGGVLARPTRHLPCLRCRARTTAESAVDVEVVPRVVARAAWCTTCGATWRNLRGSIAPVRAERRRWLASLRRR